MQYETKTLYKAQPALDWIFHSKANERCRPQFQTGLTLKRKKKKSSKLIMSVIRDAEGWSSTMLVTHCELIQLNYGVVQQTALGGSIVDFCQFVTHF